MTTKITLRESVNFRLEDVWKVLNKLVKQAFSALTESLQPVQMLHVFLVKFRSPYSIDDTS